VEVRKFVSAAIELVSECVDATEDRIRPHFGTRLALAWDETVPSLEQAQHSVRR